MNTFGIRETKLDKKIGYLRALSKSVLKGDMGKVTKEKAALLILSTLIISIEK